MHCITLSDVVMAGGRWSIQKLLCIKREAFSHEAEVRLLYQDWPDRLQGSTGAFTYPLVVNEEVVFNPRLDHARFGVLMQELVANGCALPIKQSPWYRVPGFVISP
jgi:hypothetical protein